MSGQKQLEPQLQQFALLPRAHTGVFDPRTGAFKQFEPIKPSAESEARLRSLFSSPGNKKRKSRRNRKSRRSTRKN